MATGKSNRISSKDKEFSNFRSAVVLWLNQDSLAALASGSAAVLDCSSSNVNVAVLGGDSRRLQWFVGVPAELRNGLEQSGREEPQLEVVRRLFDDAIAFEGRFTDDLERVQVGMVHKGAALFNFIKGSVDAFLVPIYAIECKLESELPSIRELAIDVRFGTDRLVLAHRTPQVEGTPENWSLAWIFRRGNLIAMPLWMWFRDGTWTLHVRINKQVPPVL